MNHRYVRALIPVALLIFADSTIAQSADDCDVSDIFDLDNATAECEIQSNNILISLPWSDSLIQNANAIATAKARLEPKLPDANVLVQDFRSTGAGPRALATKIDRRIFGDGRLRRVQAIF